MVSFGFFKEPKNIIELFTFDLTTFFYDDDYDEISCVEDEGIFMIEYEKVLPWTEFDIFSTVIFRVFNEKKNIIGSSNINVRFINKIDISKKKNIVKIVNKLNKIYGSDDDNKDDWSVGDDNAFELKKLKRQWTLGEGKNIYTVILLMKNDDLLFEILFFNHLLELIK